MVLDRSALVAILKNEPERDRFLRLLSATPRPLISAATLVECSLVIEGERREAGGAMLDALLRSARVEVVPVDETQAEAARDGWRRYGKGRHPAALDLGDLFSYALAKATGEPLLFKGDDFAQTDVRSATSPGSPDRP